MKKFITLVMIASLLGMLLTGFRSVAGPNDFALTIANDVQTSDRTFEFDLILRDTDPTEPFELSAVQAGIVMNPALYNGGTITVTLVAGSSQLLPAQQPNNVIWSQSQNAIKLTPMSLPAIGQGSIISQAVAGTRVTRFLVTNTVAFAQDVQANLAFSFLTNPYATRVAQNYGGISLQLTCSAANCYSVAANLPLNTSLGPVTTIGSMTAVCGNSPVQVPVTVTNFNQVGSVSLTITYNTSSLDFVSGVNTSAYPSLTFNEPSPGVIKVAGFSTDPLGVSLAANATLITLNFIYLSGTGSIQFDNSMDNFNEYGGIPPMYIPYNDDPASTYYIGGTITGDVTPPTITCPADAQATASAGSCFVLNPALGTPVTGDNCGVASVTNNFATLFPTGEVPIGLHTITWTVTDVNGIQATCQQSLTILQGPDPTFQPIGPFCQNSIAPALPGTSLNGITGTWNPAVISTSVAGSFDYTFTPDASFCSEPYIMTIVIDAPVIPTFTEIGSLCQFSTPPALPLTSNNGISGTWNPAVINTATTGTTVYTFTPDAGFCATTTTMSITIDTQVTPMFNQIGPLCQNSTPPALPLTSNNNVTGTWNPAVISTSTPGSFIYTFTPNAGGCAILTTMTIVVDPLVTPTFTQIGPLCQNSTPPALPTTSLNNVAGTWSPSAINTTVAGDFTYTFTPTDPYCTTTATMVITINPTETPVFTQIDPLCLNSTAPVLPATSGNGIPGTWNPAVISTTVAGTFEYVFTPNTVSNPCAVSVSMFITIHPLPTATISGSTTTWAGVPVDLTVDLTGTAPWTYYWSDDNGVTTHMVNAATTPSVFSVSPSVTTTYIITSVEDANGCTNSGTGTATVTINSATVSGNISYYNIAGTPMNNVQVILSQNSVTMHTATTNAGGNYSIAGVPQGTYDVSFITAKPAGGINATDAAQLNAWGVGPQYAIEKVRFLAGDVVGPDIINATDAARVLTHFVTSGNPPFSSNWTFWNTNDMVSTNVPQTTQLTLTVPAATTTVTANYYALATGDFNRSFTPGSAKNAAIIDGLTLGHDGIIEVYPDEVFMLPITAGIDMNISAISLILEFPADRLEILGVYLGNDLNSPLEYAVIGNQLRIGWQSIIHKVALTGDAVVTLKVKNLVKIEENETLSFNLYPDTLNELADENYEVIYGALLLVDDIKGNTVGTGDMELHENITFSGYPNPTSGKVTLSYSIPEAGKVNFEVTSMLNSNVRKSGGLIMSAGEHTINMDFSTLVKGIYAVTMKVEMANGLMQSKTIKVVKH